MGKGAVFCPVCMGEMYQGDCPVARCSECGHVAAPEVCIDRERAIADLTGMIERQIDQGAVNVARHLLMAWGDIGRAGE